MSLIDLTGQSFGKITVIDRATNSSNRARATRWRCRCACGTETIVLGQSLRRGNTRSCGCSHGELHGLTDTREWATWSAIRNRCANESHKSYAIYGGRGIRVCARWQESFRAFLEDMGKCPARLTLERIDNDGDYEPANCRWATMKEQANNTRRNRWLVHDGERRTLIQWSEHLGLDRNTIVRRLDLDWSVDAALTTPVKGAWKLVRRGQKKTIGDWSRETGIFPATIRKRLRSGWSVDKALTLPLGSRKAR